MLVRLLLPEASPAIVPTRETSIEETIRRHDVKTRLAGIVARERLGWEPRQVARLLELHREAGGAHLKVDEPGSYESHTRATSALICGDFNLPPTAVIQGIEVRLDARADSNGGAPRLWLCSLRPSSRKTPIPTEQPWSFTHRTTSSPSKVM